MECLAAKPFFDDGERPGRSEAWKLEGAGRLNVGHFLNFNFF
jgi:hypothetical protein